MTFDIFFPEPGLKFESRLHLNQRMKVRPTKFHQLIEEIDRITDSLEVAERKHVSHVESVHKRHRKSARNLIHYRKWRSYDLRDLQKQMENLGLTSFTHSEQHVLFNLHKVRFILEKLLGSDKQESYKSGGLSIKSSRKILNRNTEDILGPKVGSAHTRLMVTIPTTGANDQALVDEMVRKGMAIARINCSHDEPAIWEKMIQNIRRAEERFGRKVKIAMDLGGPKIRTGQITPCPPLVRLSPKRDQLGRVVVPRKAFLIPTEFAQNPLEIPVNEKWLKKIELGDIISCRDTRDKARKLRVVDIHEEVVTVECHERIFLTDGIDLRNDRTKKVTTVGHLPKPPGKIRLSRGDELILNNKPIPGEAAKFDEQGRLLALPHIACTLPEIIDKLKVGDSVKFDDGKIGASVVAKAREHVRLKVIETKGRSVNLRADKGINTPGIDLEIPSLTGKDKEDLKFIVDHADAVNVSFINTPDDVQDLFDELDRLDARGKLGVILKVETQGAYNNLVNILLKGMEEPNLGVLIARGDLAVETGWNKMGRIQEEILSICSSAHIPVIWATQVLESLAKKGIPSRSEITDAITSIRAEGVMLNKGPYVHAAMDLLCEILSDAGDYQDKGAKRLHELEKV